MDKEFSLDLCFEVNFDDAKLLLAAIEGLSLTDEYLKDYLLRELKWAVRSFDPPAPRPDFPQKKWKKW